MGRVDCVRWPGCDVWFWPKDHREAHFHVKSPGEWEVRVFFGTEPPHYDVVWQVGRVPAKAMKQFLRDVGDNRERLYLEWDAKVVVEE